ncbi:PRC-barrel domain-containing protein [Arthrobacter pigmenti]
MVNMQELQHIMEQDGNVVDREGGKIGKIGHVYLDDQSNEPEWVTASTGLFGTSESFVPLKGAVISGNDVAVTYSKDMIKEAPRVEADGHLSGSEEADLYNYYGLDYAGVGNAAGGPGAAGTTGAPKTVGPEAGIDETVRKEQIDTDGGDSRG